MELFGKKDIATVIRSAQVISGNDCLGATETSLQTIALLCLATIAGVSGDTFIAIFPQAFPKAMNVLATSMNKESKHDHLHNAVYSFLSTLLLHAPWTVRGADLDKFLDVSYKSANAGMGDQCDSSRREALNHVPQRIEAKECFAALDRTWTNAVTEGPRVRVFCCTNLTLNSDNGPGC